MEKPKKKIGQILVDAGVIDEMQLKSALGYQNRWGGKLGKILVEMGFLDEDTMIKFLGEHFHIKAVNLLRSRISNKAFEALPKDTAKKYNVVPVMVRGEGTKKVMVLAMSDPANLSAIDEISFITGAKIEPVLATDSAIDIVLKNYGDYDPEKALKQYYQEYATPAKLKKEKEEKAKPEKPKKHTAEDKISQASRQLDEELFDFDSNDDLKVVEGDVIMLKADKQKAGKAPPEKKQQPARQPDSSSSGEVILGRESKQDAQKSGGSQSVPGEESPFLMKEEPEDESSEPTEEPVIEELSEVAEEPEPVEAPVIEAPSIEEEAGASGQEEKESPDAGPPPLPEQEEQQDGPQELPDLDSPPAVEASPLPEREEPAPAGQGQELPDLDEPTLPGKEEEEQKPASKTAGPPSPLEIPESDEDLELADAHEFMPYQESRGTGEISASEEDAQNERQQESVEGFEFIPPSPNLEAHSDSEVPAAEEEEQQVELADAHEFMFMTETPDQRQTSEEKPEPEQGPPDLAGSTEQETPEARAEDSVPSLDDAFLSSPAEEKGPASSAPAAAEGGSGQGVPDFDSGPFQDSQPAAGTEGASPEVSFESLDSSGDIGPAEEASGKAEGPSGDIPPLPDLDDLSAEPASAPAGAGGELQEDSAQSATFSGDDMPLPEIDLEEPAKGASEKIVSLPFEGPPPEAEEKAQEPPPPEEKEELFEPSQPAAAQEKIPQDSEDLNDVSLPPLFTEPDEEDKGTEEGPDQGFDFGDLPGPPELDSIWASSSPPSAGTERPQSASPAEQSAAGPAEPPGQEQEPGDDLESLWTHEPPSPEPSPPDLDFSSPSEEPEKEEAQPPQQEQVSAAGELRSVKVVPDESDGIEESLDEISKLDALGEDFLDTREVKQRLEKVSSLESTLLERENNFDELLALMMKKETGEITKEAFMKELRKLKGRVDESRKKK
ncbi:MAG: hypothetical protein R6V10_03290 [bacterium]